MSDETETLAAPEAVAKPRSKGGRPRKTAPVDFTTTSEFQNAVVAATAQIVAKMGNASAAPDAQDWMRTLALNIAELTDQGSQRKRVAPEILEQRGKARERMIDLIIAARKEKQAPEYAVLNKIYLNEVFVEPYHAGPDKRPVRTEIIWSGVPNEVMRPLNEVAKNIYREFRASIGNATGGTPRDDNRSIWMTAGGLIVKGNAAGQRREVGNLGDPMPILTKEEDDEFFSESLSVRKAHDPTAKEVRVLGTIHPPAQQNVHGDTPYKARV